MISETKGLKPYELAHIWLNDLGAGIIIYSICLKYSITGRPGAFFAAGFPAKQEAEIMLANIIVMGLILAYCGYVIYREIRNAKNGISPSCAGCGSRGGCAGHCSGCSGCGTAVHSASTKPSKKGR